MSIIETQLTTNDPAPEPPRSREINIQKLADKVYRLMLADIRRAHDRGESSTSRKGREL